MGHGQRIGVYTRDGVANNMDPVSAPAVIRDLFKDPDAARARAAAATNNAELQRMRDEDQADREEPIDQAKITRMRMNDSLHQKRTLGLIAEGVPRTGRDMHNAATVLQHGGAEAKPLPLDTTGVNDRIRVALGSRRLADAAKAPGTR
jgi:hypothetical protein